LGIWVAKGTNSKETVENRSYCNKLLYGQIPRIFYIGVCYIASPLQLGAGLTFSIQGQCYGFGNPGFESRLEKEILLLSETSRPALGLNQPPVVWVPSFIPGDEVAGL
jgi:hypothetical protein